MVVSIPVRVAKVSDLKIMSLSAKDKLLKFRPLDKPITSESRKSAFDSVERNLSFGSLGYGVEDIEGNPISVP